MLKEIQISKQKTIQFPGRKEDEKKKIFNTKGYYTSEEPYDSEYLKAKQKVFKKYRKENTQLVFIDPKMTKPSAFIHKGMMKPCNNIYNESNNSNQKVLNSFLKNYIVRKQKKQMQEEEKYFSRNKQLLGISEIQINTAVPRTARSFTRSVYSRISTTRSNKQN